MVVVRPAKGFTLLELMITLSIIMILASVALPFSKMAARRAKEFELRQSLRVMREAIDEFHQDYLTIPYKGTTMASDVAGESGYPKSLEILVKGVKNPKSPKETVKRYLRKIPVDPMTRSTDWGFRCNSDEPDSEEWCQDDVFDVYSKSDGIAIDKSKYKDW
ncbi:MAG: type II secretion system protein [Nitrospiria bacterium]